MHTHMVNRPRSVFRELKTVKVDVGPYELVSAFSLPPYPMVLKHNVGIRCSDVDVFDLTIASTDVCAICRSKNLCPDSKRIRHNVLAPSSHVAVHSI